jgi:hypothetical protein
MVAAPKVTADEILRVFADDDHVFTAPQIADRVWRQRGGSGSSSAAVYRRESSVPLVRASTIARVLDAMVTAGFVERAIGEEAGKLGSVFGDLRGHVTYYALASSAQQHRDDIRARDLAAIPKHIADLARAIAQQADALATNQIPQGQRYAQVRKIDQNVATLAAFIGDDRDQGPSE